MKALIDTLRPHICADAMLETALEVSKHHRIQASPGFRDSARYCIERLRSYGIEARLLQYPADGVHRVTTDRTLKEWVMVAGGCEIDGFGQIADYEKEALSVIVRSTACDFRRDGLEVIYLDKSDDEADYEGLDLTGKLAFVRGNINSYAWVCQKRGGAGLITDFVLHPDTQQNILRYTSYWWKEEPDEIRYFGFCLSPKQGKALAEHLLRARENGTPVMARGFVEASFVDGFLDVVEAVLPGETAEEVLVTSHLCHPKASSNDNASGVAACIEGMRVLKAALDKGELPALRRGVRLLLVPEMSGTAAWLRSLPEGETKRYIAAINLDMVGGKQEPGYGPLVITSLPRSTPSFTEYAAMQALEAAVIGYTGHNPHQPLPALNHAIAGFDGGSDHYILSDPTIGIPCTMLGQWPDANYHTSGDTMDKLSPETLTASCATMAGFCASMAGLNAAGLPALFNRGKVRFAEELALLCRRKASDMAFGHLLHCYQAAFRDAARLFPGDAGVQALIDDGCDGLEQIFGGFRGFEYSFFFQSKDTRVPVRHWSQPIHNIDLAARSAGKPDALEAYEKGPRKAFSDAYMSECLCYYYMDGTRSVDEILARTAIDRNEDVSPLKDFIALLAELGLVTFK